MNSIFKTLFNLKIRSSSQPFEDYLTEVFAFCLSSYPDMLTDFLRKFEIHNTIYNYSNIKTQNQLTRLPNHDTDSKPDIIIYLDNKTIFIESKINSKEGNKQLQRYAEHLNEYSKSTDKVLIYLTRDYDLKDKSLILSQCKNPINFLQIRWYEIYQLLNNTCYQTNIIIQQLKHFMSEYNLSSNNQFTPVDLITLNNFSRLMSVMDETMQGEVYENLKRFGIQKKISSQVQQARYVYVLPLKEGMCIMLGYWFNSKNSYPEIRIKLEIAPNSNVRKLVLEAFKSITLNQSSRWFAHKLDNVNAWSSINIRKNLQAVLSDSDHIKSVRQFFIDGLIELENVRSNYPQLPWKN
jgi:hypothetical protein